MKREAQAGSRGDLRQALILLGAAFLLAWAPRLLWGFWTDETGTFWMASQGWQAAIGRSAQWAGQSLLFGVIESFFVFPGPQQELWLRIPSLAGAGLAAWYVYRLMERFVHPGSGAVAIVTLLCLPDVVTSGTNARPYALVLAAACASSYYLIEWREMGASWRSALAYAASAALLVNLHYLAAFLLLPHSLYLLTAWLRKDGPRIGWNLPLAAGIAIPIAILPLLGALRLSVAQAPTFAGAQRPEWMQLLTFCTQPLALLGVLLGAGLSWFSRRKLKLQLVGLCPENAILFLSWWLLAPVVFFLSGRYGDHNVFASRYMLMTAPAFAILIGWLATTASEGSTRRMMACGLFAATTLHPGMLLQNFGPAPESWREPLASARSFSEADQAPVLITAGIAESNFFDWKAEDPATSRFYAALTAYPIHDVRAYGVPFAFDENAATYLEGLIGSSQFDGKPIVLVSVHDSDVHKWFKETLGTRGYRIEDSELNRFTVTRASPDLNTADGRQP